jgi:hypothetical protein
MGDMQRPGAHQPLPELEWAWLGHPVWRQSTRISTSSPHELKIGLRTYGLMAGIHNGNGYGVYGSSSGYAGYFQGDVHVNGTLSSNVKDFKIDDPLDPANKYLYHTSVESPDMMDLYSGNITTDARGEARIALPSYFEALNRDFRYQLTVIDGQFAQAVVSSKIKDNHFTIKTDKPNVEVSWLVTGVRQDPYANAHPSPVEQAKPANEKGYYLHPELYGEPATKSVDPYLRISQSAPSPTTPVPGGN